MHTKTLDERKGSQGRCAAWLDILLFDQVKKGRRYQGDTARYGLHPKSVFLTTRKSPINRCVSLKKVHNVVVNQVNTQPIKKRLFFLFPNYTSFGIPMAGASGTITISWSVIIRCLWKRRSGSCFSNRDLWCGCWHLFPSRIISQPAISWWTLTEMEWPIWMDPSSLRKQSVPAACSPAKKTRIPFFLQEKHQRNSW